MHLWLITVSVLAILASGNARPAIKKIQEDIRGLSGSSNTARTRLRRSTGNSCFVIALFDNHLDRMIKIIPSRSTRGKYFIESRAYLQVNITMECNATGILFKAVDQEKQSKVLVNSSESVTIVPTSNPYLVHPVTITPQALKVIPSRSYAFLSIASSGTIGGFPDLNMHNIESEVQEGGLSLDGVSSYIDGSLQGNDCALNPANCPEGFTISTKVTFDSSFQGNPNNLYVIDTGAQSANSSGFTLYLKDGKLKFELRTTSKKWEVETTPSIDEKMYYIFTWKETTGLLAYMNSLLTATDDKGVALNSTQHGQEPNIMIGRNVIGPTYSYGEFVIESMTTFDTFIASDDVLNVNLFLWSSYMAKGFYARIRPLNVGQRNAKLMPSRGKPDGFVLPPYQKLSIVMIELSTKGVQPEPVDFTAVDEASGVPLLLNDNINGVSVSPVESPKDFVNLIVTLQEPTTSPRYTWPTVAISNGQVATTPPFTAHGNAQVVANTILFDGVNSYLNAGIQPGQCLSDPNKCLQGLTLGMKVKFPSGAASHSTPKVVFDSGIFTGKGLSVYLRNGNIHAVVALGSVMYTVSSPVTVDLWLAISVQYKSGVGILLASDQQTLAASNTSVPFTGTGQQGNVTIGRDSAGMQPSFANFYSEIFVFYETVLPAMELAKVSLYYYSYASNVALTRYSNVDFVNLAGKEVRIYPDKGANQQNGYVVQTGATLQLRLSEQGTESDFPITYAAEDPVTSDTVYIQGLPSYLVVQSNANATVSFLDLTNNQ